MSGNFFGNFALWLNRALTFLVVSCPCALVISVPLTFFGGIGGASKSGILIKGSNYIDALSKTGVVVFDKTGTLTKGVFAVTAVHPESCDENRLLHLAAHVERFSTHPIALSLRQAYPNEADDCRITDVEEIAGHGIRAKVNDDIVCVGNTRMMDSVGAKWLPCEKIGTIIHVSINGKYAGHIVISDQMKEDSKRAILALKAAGVSKTVMLTGDREEVGRTVAEELGIDEYRAELLPADKVENVERLLSEKPSGRTLAFVGDGINDAPVLARADVGIAMGAVGSDAAIEAADIVLMDDKPSKIARAIEISKRTCTPEYRVRTRCQTTCPCSRRVWRGLYVARCFCRRGRYRTCRIQCNESTEITAALIGETRNGEILVTHAASFRGESLVRTLF